MVVLYSSTVAPGQKCVNRYAMWSPSLGQASLAGDAGPRSGRAARVAVLDEDDLAASPLAEPGDLSYPPNRQALAVCLFQGRITSLSGFGFSRPDLPPDSLKVPLCGQLGPVRPRHGETLAIDLGSTSQAGGAT